MPMKRLPNNNQANGQIGIREVIVNDLQENLDDNGSLANVEHTVKGRKE